MGDRRLLVCIIYIPPIIGLASEYYNILSRSSNVRKQFKIFKTEIRHKITSTGNASVLTVKTYIEIRLLSSVVCFVLAWQILREY